MRARRELLDAKREQLRNEASNGAVSAATPAVNAPEGKPSDWQLDGCSTVKVGDHLTVCGLQSEQKWNGQRGVVAGWDDEKGRWNVDLSSGGNINLKPQNVKLTKSVRTDERSRSCTHVHTGDGCCVSKLPTFLPPSATACDVEGMECGEAEETVVVTDLPSHLDRAKRLVNEVGHSVEQHLSMPRSLTCHPLCAHCVPADATSQAGPSR